MVSILRMALVLLLATVTSCSTVDRDPEYQKLAACHETNPKPDAIVGMWHRKVNDWDGVKWRLSLLARRDGRGTVDSYFFEAFIDQETVGFEKLGDFAWTYKGQGIWELRSLEHPEMIDECRLSGGKLLRFSKRYMLGPGRLVYERVSP